MSDPIKVLVIIDIAPAARDRFASLGYDVVLAGEVGGRDAAIEVASDARVVLTNGSLGLRTDEIARLPKLELILAIGAGFEKIDVALATERGITVTNGRGTNTIAVADHAMTLLLAAAATIVPANAAVKRGEWSNFASPRKAGGARTDFPFKRVGVTGRRLGILGLGMIGTAIAKRAALGFDMEIAYHNRSVVPDVPYAYLPSLLDLAAWADFLMIAAPGGAGTQHIVNADVLAALGANGYLVNIGRGSIVDTDALVAALREGTIAGAALDVVEGEPNIPPALRELDNLLLTPHMAGRTEEAITLMQDQVARNLVHFANGDPLENVVNP